MAQMKYFCNDPSHPQIISSFSQETSYRRILRVIDKYKRAGVSKTDIANLTKEELLPQLTILSDSVYEGYRVQRMRRRIAQDWGDVFCKIDNLCYLMGWFFNETMRGDDELQYVLSLLAFEAIRNVFATVNQLRAALTQDTFGYWRTLYETLGFVDV